MLAIDRPLLAAERPVQRNAERVSRKQVGVTGLEPVTSTV
jgi:hypothetical protein